MTITDFKHGQVVLFTGRYLDEPELGMLTKKVIVGICGTITATIPVHMMKKMKNTLESVGLSTHGI